MRGDGARDRVGVRGRARESSLSPFNLSLLTPRPSPPSPPHLLPSLHSFDLTYATEGGSARPVIVHRAILGSVERMFAILVEHYAGKWPLWLSPRQVMVVPISAVSVGYAKEVRAALRGAGFHAEVDAADKKMQKKVREAQLAQFNYILVVGEAESAARTVNVRTRDNHVHGMHALEEVVAVMRREVEEKSLVGLFEDADAGEGGGGGEGGGKGEGGAAPAAAE